nr:hypothetical protein BaRGS_023235 [Batillaria attramentaria]
MVIISGVVSIYYNVIITYAIYYMWVSFTNLDDALPWADCNNWWRSEQCRDKPYPDFNTLNETEAKDAILNDVYKQDCLREKMLNSSFRDKVNEMWGTNFGVNNDFMDLNSTMIRNDMFKDCAKTFISPADDFWTNYVLRLNEAEDFGNLGGISLKIILTLALAWILIFFCLMKGVKSSGKVVYFTATFPYVILVVLLVRGVTLDGYMEGINFYVIPQWEKLKDAKVWGDAATQIFYSLGVGFGGLLTMASYNKFKNNCYRDAIMVALINCSTSIFAGFAVFSLLGHMAHVTNQDVADVASDGYKNFSADIEMMVGFKPNIYWLATWLVITPLAIAFIIIIGAIQYTKAYYNGYQFEDWVQGIGWVMVVVPLLAIVIVALIQMCRYGVPGCFKPLEGWGPSDDENRTGRYAPLNSSLPYQIPSVTNGKPGPINGAYDNAAFTNEKGNENVQFRL